VGEEQVRPDVPAQIAQVLVGPGRPYLPVKARFRMITVPAQPNPSPFVPAVVSRAWMLCEISECEGSVT
jgi:hypothetical protein